MNCKEIQELMCSMKENNIYRIELKSGFRSIMLEKEQISTDIELLKSSVQEKTSNSKEKILEKPVKKKTHSHLIRTPLIGTFYRASEPDGEPFVQLNQNINKGDTLCIVEAMKSMNEIKADRAGMLIEICKENGDLVECNELLFRLKD